MSFVLLAFNEQEAYPIPREYIEWTVKDIVRWQNASFDSFYLITIDGATSLYISGQTSYESEVPIPSATIQKYRELPEGFIVVAKTLNGHATETIYVAEPPVLLAGLRVALSILDRGTIGYLRFNGQTVSVGAMLDLGELSPGESQ